MVLFIRAGFLNGRFLALSSGVDVLASGEGLINSREAEASVQGGAFEGRAVPGEGDALRDVRATSELDLGFDAVGFQVGGEGFPAGGCLQGGFHIVCHFISGTFIRAELLCPCLGFAFAKGQTVFLLESLTDTDIPFQPVAVGDSFAVVVHTVEDEMAVGIGSVVVTDYYILSFFYTHLFHIFLCYLCHKFIGQAWLVFWLKAYGNMADRLADPWVQLGLNLEAFGSYVGVVGDDAVVGDDLCLILAVGV